jgi:hypothetical protein
MILVIGTVLIACRCFFPVEERLMFRYGTPFPTDSPQIAKTVNVPKTAFQCIGIALVTGALFASYKKEEPRPGKADSGDRQ